MIAVQTIETRSTTPPAQAAPLTVDSLVKRFGQTTAVGGVSLTVRASECVGLLGPNGAGKSTLIRSIVGRVIPDSGRVEVFGFPSGSTQARMALGWVPQELAIYPRITARENLASFGRYYGLSGRKLAESVSWCLGWAALEDKAGELAKNLSGGMKRRLNMAAGMIQRPQVVLLDEPTVGVDPQSRNRIFEMIEALRRDGAAIVYTTHYMEEAERLCDRIAIIDHGRLIACDTTAALLQQVDDKTLAIALVEPVAALPPALSALGLTLAGPGRLIYRYGPSRTRLDPVLAAIRAAGLTIRDLTTEETDLEEVFLRLTHAPDRVA